MIISIAHLGPTGTYTETATLAYRKWLAQEKKQEALLCPYPTIAQTFKAVATEEVDLAVVPVENSIHGSVTITLDSLWELPKLQIQQGLILPISHTLLSQSKTLEDIAIVYSHYQALGQCQRWLENFIPQAQLITTNSTTEALEYLSKEPTAAAISSERASKLYKIPILASNINDYPDNCTRFLILGLNKATVGTHISLAFTVPANIPGSLLKPLQAFAKREINLSRIESRPTKRSLGEYLFFIDLESNSREKITQDALAELSTYTKELKIFGNYKILTIKSEDLLDL